MNAEKMLEQKWIVTVFLLIVPTALRCFDLLTEGGLITVWLLVAGGYFAADVTQKATTGAQKATPNDPA
jgi:hypothetical protein